MSAGQKSNEKSQDKKDHKREVATETAEMPNEPPASEKEAFILKYAEGILSLHKDIHVEAKVTELFVRDAILRFFLSACEERLGGGEREAGIGGLVMGFRMLNSRTQLLEEINPSIRTEKLLADLPGWMVATNLNLLRAIIYSRNQVQEAYNKWAPKYKLAHPNLSESQYKQLFKEYALKQHTAGQSVDTKSAVAADTLNGQVHAQFVRFSQLDSEKGFGQDTQQMRFALMLDEELNDTARTQNVSAIKNRLDRMYYDQQVLTVMTPASRHNPSSHLVQYGSEYEAAAQNHTGTYRGSKNSAHGVVGGGGLKQLLKQKKAAKSIAGGGGQQSAYERRMVESKAKALKDAALLSNATWSKTT